MEPYKGYSINEVNEAENWSQREYVFHKALIDKSAPGDDTIVTTQHVHAKLVSPNKVIDPALITDNSGNLLVGTTPSALRWGGIDRLRVTATVMESISPPIATIDAPIRTFAVEAQTTGDAADGFGPSLEFQFTDTDAATKSVVAKIQGVRDDASDTEGKLVFRNGTNGDEIRMLIAGTGPVTVGNVDGGGAFNVRPPAGVCNVWFISQTNVNTAIQWMTDQTGVVATQTYQQTLVTTSGEMWFHKTSTRNFWIAPTGAGICAATEGSDVTFELWSDQGDDNADKWRLIVDAAGNNLRMQSYATGAWVTRWQLATGGTLTVAGTIIFSSLSGVGARAVIAAADGTLSAP